MRGKRHISGPATCPPYSDGLQLCRGYVDLSFRQVNDDGNVDRMVVHGAIGVWVSKCPFRRRSKNGKHKNEKNPMRKEKVERIGEHEGLPGVLFLLFIFRQSACRSNAVLPSRWQLRLPSQHGCHDSLRGLIPVGLEGYVVSEAKRRSHR